MPAYCLSSWMEQNFKALFAVSRNPEVPLKRNILIIHQYLAISVESEDFLVSKCPRRGVKISPVKWTQPFCSNIHIPPSATSSERYRSMCKDKIISVYMNIMII